MSGYNVATKILISPLMAAVMLLLLAGSAQAETYRWTDDGGVVHFSDDGDKIPARFRQKATIERDMSSVNIMPAARAPERAVADPAAAAAKVEAENPSRKVAEKKLKKGSKSAHGVSAKKGREKSKQGVKAPTVATTPARRAQNQAEEQIRKDRQAIDDAQMPARRDQTQAEEQIRKARDGMAGH